MDLNIDIFDITGQFIQNIHREDYVSGGYRIDDIEWNGRDHEGAEVSPGMYIYRLKIVFSNGGNNEVLESNAEKLVIFR